MAGAELRVCQPTEEDFGRWLQTKDFRQPRATVLHHTWSPNAAQYRGRDTIVGIQSYHMGTRHFSTIAANAYACPDGTVVTGRELSYGNWAHALVSRDDVEAEARAVAGGDAQWFNSHAFGLETVANFDSESPAGVGPAAHSYETALRVLTVVHRMFDIPASRLFFHRDVANKSCPGLHLQRSAVRAELARRLAQSYDIEVVFGASVVDCDPQWVGDHITVLARPVLAAIDEAKALSSPAVHANGRAFLRDLAAYVPAWEFHYRAMPQGPRVYIKRKGE